jgi:hypothetical protein
LGAVLVVAIALLGGRPAAIGAATAVLAQLAAVALLRPAMTAPQPRFLSRWLGGMVARAGFLAVLLTLAVLRPDRLPPLATSLGYLGALLPLLFGETKFLQ